MLTGIPAGLLRWAWFVGWCAVAAIPIVTSADTKGLQVRGKLIAGAVAAAVLVTPIAACSSGGTAQTGNASQPPASGSATGQATVAYDWGEVPNVMVKGCHSGRSNAGKQNRHRQLARFCGDPKPAAVSGINGNITSVATSNSDSYVLTSDGAVYAWGHGAQGELGNGTRIPRQSSAVRVHFPAGVKIVKLPNPMPFNGGMAISTAGTVYAWGNDARHQFCQPGTGNLLTPVAVPLPHVTLAAGALEHTIYDSNGTVYSCGAGPNGQLGDGTSGPNADAAKPVKVPGLPSGPVKALTSAWGNAGVLMASGVYYDWGYNQAGQVGDGTQQMAIRPVQVKRLPAVSQVSEGGSLASNGQTIALASDGRVYVWGNGQEGQLGDGSTSNTPEPRLLEEPTGVHFVKVSSGGATDYAVTSTGDLYAWGYNRRDETGSGVGVKKQLVFTKPVNDRLTVAQVSATASDVAAFAKR